VLSVPSLAERVDDIPVLVAHFVQRAGPGRPATVTPAAVRLLQEREWPGNIRELKQVVDAALAFAGDCVDVSAVRMALAHRSPAAAAPAPDAFVYERHQLSETLKRCAWDTAQTAAALGVNRATVYRRIKRLGIALPRFAFVRANSHVDAANSANHPSG
jgi:transcriptional regulator of acetoin/glycerol metabolism